MLSFFKVMCHLKLFTFLKKTNKILICYIYEYEIKNKLNKMDLKRLRTYLLKNKYTCTCVATPRHHKFDMHIVIT